MTFFRSELIHIATHPVMIFVVVVVVLLLGAVVFKKILQGSVVSKQIGIKERKFFETDNQACTGRVTFCYSLTS